MNNKLLYYTQKIKRQKEPHRMGNMHAMRIFFIICLLYFCFSKKKKKFVNCLHVTTPSEGKKKMKKMHLVGNLVEPQQYCQIHIERKNSGSLACCLILRIEIYTQLQLVTYTSPIILLNLLDYPAKNN